LTLARTPARPRRGVALRDLGIATDGALAARDGRILAAGPLDVVEKVAAPGPGCREIDAAGRVVMPGFVDAHTHAVFAEWRVEEYEWRVAGTSYETILARGGGILRSVEQLRATDEETLFRVSLERVARCISIGNTTIEIKTGYGLDFENELKQLRVIRRLARSLPARIVPTFLGAHALPPEFRDRREAYLDWLCREMIPRVAEMGLAEFVDVFCERGVFEPEEAERILRAGREAGLRAKLHGDQLHDTGSAELAVRVGATSVDHLDRTGDRGIDALARSSVIGVLLPGTSFGLPSLHFAPARRMVERGVAIALATDFNPGSSPTESMPLMLSIACSHMGLSPAEAVAAATYNAAFAVGLEGEVGSLEVGKRADFLILDAEDYRELPYRAGVNLVAEVFLLGRRWDGLDGVEPGGEERP
jgi:imidazolonepropionase